MGIRERFSQITLRDLQYFTPDSAKMVRQCQCANQLVKELLIEIPPVWASLVAQWLRIRLPTQGTWVQALVREDPTCRGATKPVHHNY